MLLGVTVGTGLTTGLAGRLRWSRSAKERCESGRIGLTANELTGEKPVRGFKSLPLRKS